MLNLQKKELRDFFGVKNIRDAKRLFGINSFTNDRAYDYLDTLYTPVRRQQKITEAVERNTLRRIRQNLLLGRQQETMRNIITRRRMGNAIPLEGWGKFVDAKRQGNFTKPFTLILKSSEIFGLTKTFNFDNYFHFIRWFNDIQNESIVATSSEQVLYQDVINQPGNKDAFKFAVLEVKSILGGCNKNKASSGGMLGDYYNFKFHNPTSRDNNCGLACLESILKIKLSYMKIRKQFKIEPNVFITPEQLRDIYKANGGVKFLCVIGDDFCGVLNDEYNYIHYKNNHYKVITGGTPKEKPVWTTDENGKEKHSNVRRKLLAYDFETRPIDPTDCDTNPYRIKTGKAYRYPIKDSICSIHYESITGVKTKTFITNSEKSSARQFVDWLTDQHKRNTDHYVVIAHNGSRFDNLILYQAMTEEETVHTFPQLRGYSLIGMEFMNHIFRDPCCFLVGNLETLCKNFKVKNSKKTTDIYKGMDNKQLCFYRPELTLEQFLDLQNTEPEYWAAYVDYCEMDCISLMELWKKFSIETNGLIKRMATYTDKNGVEKVSKMVGQVSVNSSTTIGGLSKKLINALNPIVSKMKFNPMEEYLKFIGDDDEKYAYVCKLKRGGVSHCNKPGKHNEPIVGIDITSQYPTALQFMTIPTGKSSWVKEYSETLYGYYTIKNLKWDNDRKFRPICKSIDRKSRH